MRQILLGTFRVNKLKSFVLIQNMMNDDDDDDDDEEEEDDDEEDDDDDESYEEDTETEQGGTNIQAVRPAPKR